MRLQTGHIVAAAVLAFVFFLISHDPVWHTDVWAHMRFGEYIVREHKLPDHEMFSGDFADQEQPYLNFQWLPQTITYLVYELGARLAGGDYERQLAGGALALATEHALLVTLRLLVMLFIFHRLTGSVNWALFGVVVVVALSLAHISVHRPQAFGELWFALLFLALTPKKGSASVSWSAVVFIPLVLVLWANCHGSFPMGFAVLGAFVVGELFSIFDFRFLMGKDQPKDWPEIENRKSKIENWKRLFLALCLSLAAVTVLNPHGPRLFLYSIQMSGNDNIKYIEEWKPLPVKSMAGCLFLASCLLLAPLLRLSPRRFTATQVLLLAGVGLQTLAHARVLVWWAPVVVWVALPHAQAVLARRRMLTAARPTFIKALLTVAVALLGLLLSAPGLWACAGVGLQPERHVTDNTPWRAALYLREQYARNPQLKRVIFTTETSGDYLLWDLRLDPPVRVFSYTHVHLFTREHWQECMQVKFADAGWADVLDRHGVQFLVVENTQLYNLLMDEIWAARDRWEVVFDAPVFVAKRR